MKNRDLNKSQCTDPSGLDSALLQQAVGLALEQAKKCGASESEAALHRMAEQMGFVVRCGLDGEPDPVLCGWSGQHALAAPPGVCGHGVEGFAREMPIGTVLVP